MENVYLFHVLTVQEMDKQKTHLKLMEMSWKTHDIILVMQLMCFINNLQKCTSICLLPKSHVIHLSKMGTMLLFEELKLRTTY